MHSRLKLLESLFHSVNGRCFSRCPIDVRYVSKGSYLWSNSFCTVVESLQVDDHRHVTESPKLPDWIKSFINSNENDDDFVLPSLAKWIENREVHLPEADLESKAESMPNDEVDQISKILKNQFESPDAVVQALDGSSVEIADDLGKQILERFSFDWIPCLGFFNWARLRRGFKFSPELYTLMVDNLGKSRKFALMFELVEEMKQLDGFITRLTMGKVMRRLAKGGKLDEAIDVFRSLEQFGLPKDINAMNILIDALIKHRGAEDAEKVYQEFKDIIPPDGYTFNIRIHGLCKARKVEKAKKILDEMKDHGFDPDVVTCTSFIEAHCRNKDFRKVDEMLKYMENNGLVPSVVTYTIMLNALGKAKELNKALEIHKKMKQQVCVPDSSVYSIMIQILSKSGRLSDARELFADMAKQGVEPDTLTYNTMIAAAVRESREDGALMLLKKMEENRCKPNLQTYVPLIKLCCRLRRMKVLSFLLDHMCRNNIGLDLGAYALLVSGLCASGKLDRACSFFKESVKKGFVPMDSMFNDLVKGLDERGMDKEKDRIVELMQQAKLQESVDSSNLGVEV